MRTPWDFFCMCKCICRYMMLYMYISIMCIHRFYNSYSLVWKCCVLFWFSVEMYNCRHWKYYCKKYIFLSLWRHVMIIYTVICKTGAKIMKRTPWEDCKLINTKIWIFDPASMDFSVTSLKISIIFYFRHFCKKVEQCIGIIKEKSFAIGSSGCVCRGYAQWASIWDCRMERNRSKVLRQQNGCSLGHMLPKFGDMEFIPLACWSIILLYIIFGFVSSCAPDQCSLEALLGSGLFCSCTCSALGSRDRSSQWQPQGSTVKRNNSETQKTKCIIQAGWREKGKEAMERKLTKKFLPKS